MEVSPVHLSIRAKNPLHTDIKVDPLDVTLMEDQHNDSDDNMLLGACSILGTNVKYKLRSRVIEKQKQNHCSKGVPDTTKQYDDALKKSLTNNECGPHASVTLANNNRAINNKLVATNKQTNNKKYISLIKNTERPFQCSTCQRRFNSKSLLAVHCFIHTVEIPYTCDVCGKFFTNKTGLSAHIRLHTGNTHKCDTCKKTFNTSSYFKHILMRHAHTAQRQYQCDICQKYFISRADIQRHIVTHDGFRPLKCSTCGKRFYRRCRLTAHCRKHTGEGTPYKCDICDKYYSCNKQLIKHRQQHDAKTLFNCELCLVGYHKRKEFLLHLKNKHSDDYI